MPQKVKGYLLYYQVTPLGAVILRVLGIVHVLLVAASALDQGVHAKACLKA